MSPVEALTSVVGVSPWLATGTLPAATDLIAAYVSTAGNRPLTIRGEPIRTPLAWFGVRFGYFCSSRAAAPATIGAAIDVPPARIIWPCTMQVGHSVANALFGASVETMWAPGAWMSGLAKPSCVTPRLDQLGRLSSPSAWLIWSSSAPTEITYGSLPGAYCTASASLPRLPAAATTTRPFSHADSTAASSGSVL